MKINAQLKTSKVLEMKHLLKKFKNVFAWAYKDLKGIPLKLAQHKIELDAIIPPMSQPHFGQVWGWSPTLEKSEDFESFGIPECLELDS